MTDIKDWILGGAWIDPILNLVMQVFIAFAGILLLPISALIKVYIPNFDEGLSKLPLLFDYVLGYAGFIFQLFAIPPVIITMVVAYYTFVITTRLAFWSFKMALKWVKMLPGA